MALARRAGAIIIGKTVTTEFAATHPWHGVRLVLCAPAVDPGALARLRVLPALQDCAMVALSPACDDGRVEFDDVIDLAASSAEAFTARIQATLNGARVRARRNARYRLLQHRHRKTPRTEAGLARSESSTSSNTGWLPS